MNINYENHLIDRRTFLKAAGAVGAAGVLAACGGSSSSTTSTGGGAASNAPVVQPSNGGEPIADLVTWEVALRELESWNILYSQSASDLNVLCNCVNGLVTTNIYGQFVPDVATEWSQNSDATEWTFKLRDDVKWCDVNGEVKADMTSEDFLVALEWVLNAKKNQNNNTSMPGGYIVKAKEYNAYTNEMGDDEAKALTYKDMLDFGVGIAAPDAYTVVYTSPVPCPFFHTIASGNCLFPIPQALLDELGVDGFFGVTNETMWYNGAYLVQEYIQGNSKIFTPNPNYFNADKEARFNSVTVRIIDDTVVGYQLFDAGEIDEIDLGESALSSILPDPNHQYYNNVVEAAPKKYSYQYHFSYDVRNEDGTPNEDWNKAIANTKFRQCLMHGFNQWKIFERNNPKTPELQENNCYTMKGLCTFSDGRDYTDRVIELLGLPESDGTKPRRISDISQLKKECMEELTAIGVTFPITIYDYLKAGATTSGVLVTQQIIKDCFGDDFIKYDWREYVSSMNQELRDPRLVCWFNNGWGADYADISNFLGQEILHDENAYYSQVYSHIAEVAENPKDYQKELVEQFEEFTRLYNEANAINDDLDARYEAFAQAEAYLLDKALVMPARYDVGLQLTHVNLYSKIQTLCGIASYKYVNWETSTEAYTADEFAAFKEAYNAGKGA